MTVPKWLSFLSSLHPVYQQTWPPGMPVHTPLLSDWCFFPKVLSMLLSAHGFSHNKSWTHHGKNRVYAIWNHTRQLLLFLCSSNYIPHFSCISLFGPQTAPTNSGQPGESGNAFRRGNLQCGCEGRWGPHSLQLTPPFFYQNTRTTSLIHHSTCTSQSWVYQEYLAENKGLRARIVATGQSLFSCPWKLLPRESTVPPVSLPDYKQGLFQRKDLPDLQGIWDFLLPFTIRH